MEQRVVADEIGLALEGEAALGLHRLQDIEALEAAVGERFVGQRPQMLGRLELRRIRRQELQVDTLGHRNVLASVPAGAIEDQGDPLLWSGSHIAGKGGQHLPEEGRGHGGQQPPLGLTRRGTDEATDVEPLVALLHRSDGAFADRCPDAADQRQEADAMLVGGPELDRGIRMGSPDLRYPIAELS